MGKLKYQFELIQAIRNHFMQQGFLDVLTPPMVENPGMETHIHPFSLYKAKDKELSPLYLHTSPEFHMKGLLSDQDEDFEKIFTINYCFRDEPKSTIHRPQFLMLEWYRKNSFYTEIMDDCEALVKSCQRDLIQKGIPLRQEIKDFERITVQNLFLETLSLDILSFLDKKELKRKIEKDFKDVVLPSVDCSWDDYYFLLFLNKVEPLLRKYPYLLIYEFPEPLKALSTISQKDRRVCERFEVYVNGIELCNCFNELTDVKEQIQRFKDQAIEKNELYKYELPWPTEFISHLEKGLPKSSGVALGVERLLYGLVDIENPFYL